MPFNQVRNYHKLYGPNDKNVVSPNNDTLYTNGILDLRSEPVIVKVPKLKDRYYTFQLVDMFTNNFGYIGTNTTGTSAGIYAITSPFYKTKLPDSVIEIKSPSEFVIFAGRTAVNAEDKQDVKLAMAQQEKYQIGALSKFYPNFKPKISKKITFPMYKKSDLTNESFFKQVNFLINFTKLNKDEKHYFKKFSQLGIGNKDKYQELISNQNFKKEILKGIKQGAAEVNRLSLNLGT